MKKLEIAKVILEALFLIGLVGFMVASIKADQNRQDDIDRLNLKITDLQTTIGEQGTATKAELERMKGTLDKMSENLVIAHPELPILYAGGVMSCKRIARALSKKYVSAFALPEFSGDNAVGTALLCLKKYSAD